MLYFSEASERRVTAEAHGGGAFHEVKAGVQRQVGRDLAEHYPEFKAKNGEGSADDRQDLLQLYLGGSGEYK